MLSITNRSSRSVTRVWSILLICVGFLAFWIEDSNLYADDQFEPNDSFLTAKILSLGTYSGLSAEDDDWFKVSLAPGPLTASMRPSTNVDVNMVLYNSSSQVLASNFGSGEEVVKYNITSPGTYYIQIFPTTTITTEYTLSLDSKGVWATVLPFGPTRNGSISAFDIDEDGKDEIFVPANKAYDNDYNEKLPGGLICLEDDGEVKWTKTFPSVNEVDPRTGKTYNTTSVTTSPFFTDLDGDHKIDIVVGVGGDSSGFGEVGGIYALNRDGSIKWYFQTMDISEGGDGFPDGVYGSPVVFDIDRDGVSEVIFNAWDHRTYILDGRNGKVKQAINLADTIWSTPKIADINGDGIQEILVSADITENWDAQTRTGGIFHIISSDGEQRTPGFDQPVGNPNYTSLRGKYEPQVLWSSPQTADLDGDGHLEIIYGTGNYLPDPAGWYIRVWNHDGSSRFKLDTEGKTFATPLIADINNDGRKEIVAATLNGYVHVWDSDGYPIFSTQINSNPIFSAPIAVDIDNDHHLEIFFTQGAHIFALNDRGEQVIGGSGQANYVTESYPGSPIIKDIDHDGKLDVLSAGTTPSHDQVTLFRWSLPDDTVTYTKFLAGRYQFHQSLQKLYDFTRRFYNIILEREADTAGHLYWIDSLQTGIRAGADVARGFILSQEFTNRNLSDSEYIYILYSAFFNRDPDPDGYSHWLSNIQNGVTRGEVLDGFLYSREFADLCSSYSIIAIK